MSHAVNSPEPAWVARLEAKIDRLLEGTRKPTLRRVDRERLGHILPAIGGELGSELFAARDLFEQDSPALAIVLTGLNSKSIAQLFSRGADQVIDDYIVQRAHRELNAQLWRVVRQVPASKNLPRVVRSS